MTKIAKCIITFGIAIITTTTAQSDRPPHLDLGLNSPILKADFISSSITIPNISDAEQVFPWTTRIYQGAPVSSRGRYPFIVALVNVLTFNTITKFCAGSLLNNQTILTAGHCLSSVGPNSEVWLGVHDFLGFEPGRIRVKIRSSHLEPRYGDFSNKEHDLAILILESAIQFSEIVRPICVGGAGQEFEHVEVTTIGWGLRDCSRSSLSLLEASGDSYWCSYGSILTVTSNMICAHLEKGTAEAAPGDSGGPLFTRVPLDRTPQLVGVVSFGLTNTYTGCPVLGYPGVYTRVSQYIDWIQKTAVGPVHICPN